MDCNYPYSQGVAGLTPVQSDSHMDQAILRECLAEEIGSVIGYLECAEELRDYRISQMFRKIANDELSHFASLLQLLTGIDPEQAAEMKHQELAILTAAKDGICPYRSEKGTSKHHRNESRREFNPGEPFWDILQNAIKDELLSINAYQEQVKAATNPTIQGVLAHLQHQEKEHFVTYTKLFYEAYGLQREGWVLTD